MARSSISRKSKPYLKVIVFGALSIVSYIILFTHQDWVTEYYTRGGAHAAFPIATVFYFSFIHGTFGSNLLNVLGIEAKKRH